MNIQKGIVQKHASHASDHNSPVVQPKAEIIDLFSANEASGAHKINLQVIMERFVVCVLFLVVLPSGKYTEFDIIFCRFVLSSFINRRANSEAVTARTETRREKLGSFF